MLEKRTWESGVESNFVLTVASDWWVSFVRDRIVDLRRTRNWMPARNSSHLISLSLSRMDVGGMRMSLYKEFSVITFPFLPSGGAWDEGQEVQHGS